MDMERVQHWLDKGAQPTDRIARMLEAAGVREKTERNEPAKGRAGREGPGSAPRKRPRPLPLPEEAANAPAEEPQEAPAEEAARRRGGRVIGPSGRDAGALPPHPRGI